MSLLAQLFRHKDASREECGDVIGLGAIAAAAGMETVRGISAGIASEPEPAPAVMPPPPAVQELHADISATATEATPGRVELRPPKDVSISTTLRAVVLGGAGSAGASAPGAVILAPRVMPVVPGAPPPVFLAPAKAKPSVLPLAKDGD